MENTLSLFSIEHKRKLIEKIINLLLNIVNKNSSAFLKNFLPKPKTPFDGILDLSVDSYIKLYDIILDNRRKKCDSLFSCSLR